MRFANQTISMPALPPQRSQRRLRRKPKSNCLRLDAMLSAKKCQSCIDLTERPPTVSRHENALLSAPAAFAPFTNTLPDPSPKLRVTLTQGPIKMLIWDPSLMMAIPTAWTPPILPPRHPEPQKNDSAVVDFDDRESVGQASSYKSCYSRLPVPTPSTSGNLPSGQLNMDTNPLADFSSKDGGSVRSGSSHKSFNSLEGLSIQSYSSTPEILEAKAVNIVFSGRAKEIMIEKSSKGAASQDKETGGKR